MYCWSACVRFLPFVFLPRRRYPKFPIFDALRRFFRPASACVAGSHAARQAPDAGGSAAPCRRGPLRLCVGPDLAGVPRAAVRLKAWLSRMPRLSGCCRTPEKAPDGSPQLPLHVSAVRLGAILLRHRLEDEKKRRRHFRWEGAFGALFEDTSGKLRRVTARRERCRFFPG